MLSYVWLYSLACAAGGALALAQAPATAPLPDPYKLMQTALANEKKLADEQERYECRVTSDGAELDKSGKVKKETVEVKEQFYVNGVQVERTISKNGKDLTPDQTRKEDERVMKETVKYSNKATAAKESAKQDQQAQDILTAMMLTNGRRQFANGRSALLYDIVPNPKFQPKNMTQRFAAVLQGTMALDEQSGEMVDLNVHSVKDLKIAGGVVATLHKGFWLHVHNQPQPDGVWLNDLSEGTGDARALLFIHPYFRFKEVTDNCHLYTTSASQVGQAKTVK
ncbi:hypothetical protein DYQ86_11325 [Acidobacteria bacterium AB60]|nr:hypothetical protein DYQ86_11325 [Acidobacteria bacterium AB60]